MAFNVRALRAILTGRTGRPYPKRISQNDVSFCLVCGSIYSDDMKEAHLDFHASLVAMFDELTRLREIVDNRGDRRIG